MLTSPKGPNGLKNGPRVIHLRQAPVTLGVEDVADVQHYVGHFQELATSMEAEQAAEFLDLLHQGALHEAEHEMQELLGEGEHHH